MDKKKQLTLKAQSRKKQGSNFETLISKKWFFPLIFFIVTLIAYCNSFGVPFQFDDHIQISFQKLYHSFDFFMNISNWFKVNERPLSFFTLTINYVLHGEKVFGYHLVNFIIHFLSGLFLFNWLRILPAIKADQSKKQWFPLVVTLFFLLHPVQTQSVTYIVQRMTSLAGLFLILSVLTYTKGRLNQIGNGNFRSSGYLYFFSFLFGVLGILSKQNVAIFPFILLLVEYFFIRNKEGKIYKTYLLSALSFVVLIILVVVLVVGLPAETKTITRVQYLATQMYVIPHYFQIMLVPFGLCIDRGVKVADGFFNSWSLTGAIFLLGIIIFAFYMIKKEPVFSFGIFWIFITLSVESSIFPITDPMFDQRMYLPVIGFGMALWALLNRYLFIKKVNLLKPVVITVLLLFSVMTFARNEVWNNRITIWQDVTEKYPDYLRGWMALGKMYMNDENPDLPKSIECFERARAIDPTKDENLVDLGFAYLSMRQEDKAIECYQHLSKSSNKEFREQALKVLSSYNLSKGNIDDSALNMRNILKVKPNDENTWKSLFALYFDKKDFNKAQEIAKEWMLKQPDNSNANYLLGKACFYLKDKNNAEKYILSSIKLNSENADAMMLYANICVNKFEYDEAIRILEKAYKINNNSTIPRNIELIKKLKLSAPKPTK